MRLSAYDAETVVGIMLDRNSTNSRSLISRTLSKRATTGETGADTKGLHGLTTLYQPSSVPAAELVFVHGLGGGSRSTWMKSGDPSTYWPQEWLPRDPGFTDVIIRTFGYNSDWTKESTLNLHDFSKSLLGALQDCPLTPNDCKVCFSHVVIGF